MWLLIMLTLIAILWTIRDWDGWRCMYDRRERPQTSPVRQQRRLFIVTALLFVLGMEILIRIETLSRITW